LQIVRRCYAWREKIKAKILPDEIDGPFHGLKKAEKLKQIFAPFAFFCGNSVFACLCVLWFLIKAGQAGRAVLRHYQRHARCPAAVTHDSVKADAVPAPARVPPAAIPTWPWGAEDEISYTDDGLLHPRNDPSRARNESLYSEDGMERAYNESLYSKDGMECACNESLYARTGMERTRTRSVPCRTWNVSPRTGSNGGHAKKVDLAASAC
jgi:hypothetical protein